MDKIFFRAINQFTGRYELLDKIMIMISKKMRYVFIFLFILMMIRRHRYYSHMIKPTIFSIIVTLFVEFVIKKFYFKPRPFLMKRVHVLPPKPSRSNSSFPSKHTTLAFVAATSMMVFNPLLGSILYIFAGLTGFSRIWMGQHYPSDIIGSALLGSLISVVIRRISRTNYE